jgi:hypothetical protein
MKKSYFFKFFVFALVGALAILPSCKDYDDDISGLETSVSTVKSDLTALQSSVSSAQSAATAAQSTATDALAKANEALAAAQAAGDAEAIAALETQVEGLVAQIADINEELETLAGLEARIEALMAELEAANAAQLEAIVADVEAITAELSEMVAPITSMTLIPDLVSEDGSLPILDYSVLITGCEYGIAPAKTIRFYVNPSNAKEASIDKENLMVYHNAPMIRSTDAIGQSAEFVSLEDGILSVRVSVDVNKLGATPGTIDQVLLEVPFVNGGSVKSDWVRVETTEFTNEDLALVSSPLATGQTWAEKELSTTLAAAQALTYTDAPVVKLTYDGTIDLATVVKTMTNSPWADFNVEDYGLTYEYAIKNGTVDIDADNKYISLAGSVVTSKVFEVDGENPEAKDRMPIVHVRLLANAGEENECEILEGYVVIDLVAPCLDLGALQIDNYWFSDYEYTYHNSTVPGGSAEFGYTTNINNAFVTEGGQLALPYEGYSYSYIFTEDQLEDIEIDEVEYVLSVDATGTILSVTADGVTEEVATISGTYLAYQDNDLALVLLNEGPEFMKANLQLVVTPEHRADEPACINLANGEDTFDVVFLRPINLEAQAADDFIDGVDAEGEGSVIDLRDLLVLSDWRNNWFNTTDYNFEPDHEDYYTFYGIGDVEVDVDNIVPVGLTTGGTPLTSLPETMEVTQNGTDIDGTISYVNNGNKLATEFTMLIPVRVTYAGGVIETVVEVLVKPAP